jgi:hypothetical protein
MTTKIEKIRPEVLLSMFKAEMEKSKEFSFLSGIQPFLISFQNKKFHVFIKNISSAYFVDRDNTTRAQLPVKKEFEIIKNSIYPFIFLGYDSNTDVFVCWNFHLVKQRLNESKSVSFYSRKHFQEEVNNYEFLRKELKNGDTPVLFKRTNLIEFFKKIDSFFMLNPNSNNSEKQFKSYLTNVKKLSEKTILNYTRALEGRIKNIIIKNNISSNFESFYLKHEVEELIDLKNRLSFNIEFSKLNNTGKNMYSCAIDNYIEFVKYSKIDNSITNKNPNKEFKAPKNLQAKQQGKLNQITDQKLIDQLRPHLMSNRMLTATQIVTDYYANNYPNMKISDWLKLLEKLSKKY